MHDFTPRTLHRVARFVQEQLPPAMVRASVPLQVSAWEVPDEPVPFAEARDADYTPFAVGQPYGKPWGTTWFRVRGTVPADWADDEHTEPRLEVDLGYTAAQAGFQCEGAVWTPDGVLMKSLHPRNRWAPLPEPGSDFEYYIEAASNPVVPNENWISPTPMGDKATAGGKPLYTLRGVDMVLADREVEELATDVQVLRALVEQLPDAQPRRREVIAALEDMLDAIDPHDLCATASVGRAKLAPALGAPATASAHITHAVGHAHIDSAWLWPVRETQRKCARTFSNVVALMDEDPELHFACSSAQQYAWVKDAYPELFERIREKVRTGQFLPVGGMWVESDTNMPGGEAMARQFVTGCAFFRDEFGVESNEVWLPDSFGYSGAMPQIARLAGKRYFLTQKMSWNDTNTFPHHTFWWEGIDGTRVFTHFPPADTYNAEITPAELELAERQFAEKGRAHHSLLPFGYGDGGGGPTRDMVARAHRHADLEGSPRVQLSTPEQFFETAEADHTHPAVWTGEMYLEYHRGTYTSQHRTKAGNRRGEHLLREAELWATAAAIHRGVDYPAAALDDLWKQLLLQQFHDILPGSSIAWVYHDAEREYARIVAGAEQIIQTSLRALAGEGTRELVANARPVADAGVPALGLGEVGDEVAASTPTAHNGGAVLENEHVRVEIGADGRVHSLLDLAVNREVVAPGQALGTLLMCRDIPNEWDAWDINEFYKHTMTPLEPEQVRLDGDAVVVTTRHGDTTITQRLRLVGRHLDVSFDIDWHEHQQLLKWDLPLDLHADQAASEIQFGHILRPTAVNTSWDAARFETVAHRWVRVAEPDYGIALANSCTYGYSISRESREQGGTTTFVRPSLLRGPQFPDPNADQGEHHLEFSLVVGATTADAVAAGYRSNLPRRVVTGGVGIAPLITVDNPAVMVEAVKLAEDGSGDVVVRLYESLGTRATTRIGVGFGHTGVRETDLLERDLADAEVPDLDALVLRPFQIRTLRITR